MLGKRIRQANLKAKKRFKHWYEEYAPHYWMKRDPEYKKKTGRKFGALRKTNVACSCEMCRNPRHCGYTKKSEKPTVQERRAPRIEEEWE